MRIVFFVLPFIILIYFSCSSTKTENSVNQDTTSIIHFNIIIAPDLSNRLDDKLHPKPVSDYQITKTIIDKLYPEIITIGGRTENQFDKVKVVFINKNTINEYDINTSLLGIDFSKFANDQKKRIEYITGKSQVKFADDTAKFLQEYKKLSSPSKDRYGADLWSFFDSGIDDLLVEKFKKHVTYQGRVYSNEFRNILILLTDGYIEAGIYQNAGCPAEKHQCYYLSSSRIAQTRKAFLKSGETDIALFLNSKGYGIIPARNENLKELEVLVLELYDRSLTKSGTPTAYPTDLEIMRAYWSKWLKESGIKRFELRPVFATTREADNAVTTFINHK